jgi:hypothetical protein
MQLHMTDVIRNKVITTVAQHGSERFEVSHIFGHIWNDHKISTQIKHIQKQCSRNWPVEEPYKSYLNNLIGKRLRRPLRKKIEGKWVNIREFWSVEKVGRRCIFARVTLLTPAELREAGRIYGSRKARMGVKEKLLLTLADELEAQKLPYALNEQMVWDIAERLRKKGEI